MPYVHRATSQRCFVVGEVVDGHRDVERHTLGLGGAGSEAGGDVAAYDAALVQHVCTIGTIARIRAARLLRKLPICGLAGLRTLRRTTTRAAVGRPSGWAAARG